jgi:hypothetical protein
LEIEIQTFKNENERLNKVRDEQEKILAKLKRDMVVDISFSFSTLANKEPFSPFVSSLQEEFQRSKDVQMREFEAFKEEELKKIKKEKKLLSTISKESSTSRYFNVQKKSHQIPNN